MTTFFYNTFLFLGLVLFFPKFLYQYFYLSKYRKSLFYRLGIKLPKFTRGEKDFIIWIHAISIGETKSGTQLVKEIQKKNPKARVVISSGTQTGHQEAEKLTKDAFYLPVDFSWILRKLIYQIRPNVLLLIETDFWYHHLRFCKEVGAKVALVSGKISKRSTRLYHFFPDFSKELFSYIDLFCVQNNVYRVRFESIGVAPDKIQVTGNLKYDQNTSLFSEKELQEWREKLGIYEGDRVVTIASTHAPEERWLAKELKKLWQKDPSIKILLAPRHPERFASVANLLKTENISFVLLSRLHQKTSLEKVVLIDVIGFLPVCYQLSELAIIGGSFNDKIGGHNILEPNFYQVPVFFGPHMATQVELKKIVLHAQAGAQVSLYELADRLEEYFKDASEQAAMKKGAKDLVTSLKGRLDATYHAIQPMLE